MNQQPPQVQHPVVVLDIDNLLCEFIGNLYDPRNKDAAYSKQEIVVSALRFLTYASQVNEACEAMMIDIVAMYHPVLETEEEIKTLDNAICRFLSGMLTELQRWRLYDDQEELQYTFGGWASMYCPYLVHRVDINSFVRAVPLEVTSQYEVAKDYYHTRYWRPATYAPNPRDPAEEIWDRLSRE